ncbi:VPLPA-CTERM sorting domain-containing protein [Paenirhodobacter sp.]|uniref:VPLPA-CTERM sorting domain-containing protein n=1 Tax=Paenirhodobacter sp. TaxID=1965326 RepID=UPI003B3BF1B3
MKMAFTAAVLALAAPVAVNAATVTAGSNGEAFTLKPGETHSTVWNAGQAFDISQIGYTLNGAGLDTVVKSNIEKVLAEGNGFTGTTWEYITVPGGKVTFGFSYSDEFAIDAGKSFAISMAYDAAGTQDLQATYTFTATPAAVPVPAAGMLLVSALAGLGAAKRRKKG